MLIFYVRMYVLKNDHWKAITLHSITIHMMINLQNIKISEKFIGRRIRHQNGYLRGVS